MAAPETEWETSCSHLSLRGIAMVISQTEGRKSKRHLGTQRYEWESYNTRRTSFFFGCLYCEPN